MANDNRRSTRREFIRHSSALIAAMHAPMHGGVVRAATVPPSSPALLQELRLKSNKLDEQEPFYRDILGLPVERPNADTLRVTVGPSTIAFSPDADHESPFYHVAFTIPENQVQTSLDWLSVRHEVLDAYPNGDKIRHFENWNAHSIFFLDPANNILEFIGHHDLANVSNDPFGPDQMLFASEIGLVVPDVPGIVESISAQFGYTPFRGQTAPVFTALGDTRGLLLIVRESRNWLPLNGVKAQIFPTEVYLGHGADAPVLDFQGLPYRIARG